MPSCLLGIGANLGDPARQIDSSVHRLAEHPRIELKSASRHWITQPVGGPSGQPDYRNAAALIETDLPPDLLLKQLQAIEVALGRTRSTAWDARPIDLDILLYDDVIVRQPDLRIPHPWMVVRRFVLGPAAEIAPQMSHPILGWSVERLWRHLATAPPRFALVGCEQHVELAQATADAASAALIADAKPPLAEPRMRSAIPDFRQQLECLKSRVERLQESGWNAPRLAQALLGTFWIDQSLTRARATLGEPELGQFEREFARRERITEPPKLVILAVGLMRAQADRAVASGLERQLADLQRQVVHRDASPWIEVDSTNRQDFVREVAGAIVAMR